MRNPFIPSQSRICKLADTVLIFAVTVAGIAAAAACIVMQVAR